MILKRLELRNFRQFCGNQSIEFSGSPTAEVQNVTVIFGENGRGKTGIYRAVLFALFEDLKLDEDQSGGEVRLVNAHALSEANDLEPVIASVEIEFSHKEHNYVLFRSRHGARSGQRIVEEPGEAWLRITAPDSNTRTVLDRVAIREAIRAIIDPGVKEYYLFDGERMDRLTKSGATQRREVAKGIRSLLDIDALEHAREAMNRVASNFTKELTKTSSVDYARVLREIEECESQINQTRIFQKQSDDELALADEEIYSLDRELESFKEIKDLVAKRHDISGRLASRERERQALASSLGNLVARTSMLLLKDTIESVYSEIEDRRKKGELPAEIRRDLIERVLLEDRCICGRSITSDPQAHASVEAWRVKTSAEALEDATLRLWQQLGGFVRHLPDYEQEVTSNLQLYGSMLNDLAEYRRELDEIAAEIGSSERKDAANLEQLRDSADKKRVALKAKRLNLDQDLSSLRQRLEQLNLKKEEEASKANKRDEYTARVELAREVTRALDNVYEAFTTQIRERLAELATKALHDLLDSVGKSSICKVKVKEDYSLEIFNRFGEPWLSEISAGQRQVLSIAFIAALAEAASNGQLLEMPLFMDTPFGRLSSAHRDNLMRVVPTKSAQWVLLATDTEFREAEARALMATGRWGKLYFLHQGESGATQIIERPPNVQSFQNYLATGDSQ